MVVNRTVQTYMLSNAYARVYFPLLLQAAQRQLVLAEPHRANALLRSVNLSNNLDRRILQYCKSCKS